MISLKYSKYLFSLLLIANLLLFNINLVNAESYNSVDKYHSIFQNWLKRGYSDIDGVKKIITPSNFQNLRSDQLINQRESFGYQHEVAHLKAGDSFTIELKDLKQGLYTIYIDYYLINTREEVELGLEVNDQAQYLEATKILLPSLWEPVITEYRTDRYGNEVMPEQKQVNIWQTLSLHDFDYLEPDNLRLQFQEGTNKVTVKINQGEVLIGDLTVSSINKLVDYQSYSDLYQTKTKVSNFLLIREAEKYTYKNETGINLLASRDLAVTPYNTYHLLLNTLGGKTWSKSGETVYYEIEVPFDGLYNIGVRYLQDIKPNDSVFRTITIDNRIPFQELKNYQFFYTKSWNNTLLGGEEPYYFYLTKGKHLIGLSADSSKYGETINIIENGMKTINSLTIDIKRLVGYTTDRNRDWEISNYFPNLVGDLTTLKNKLEKEYEVLLKINQNENSQALISLKMAIKNLNLLIADPNNIPNRLNLLNQGTGSTNQYLNTAIEQLKDQSLLLDQIFVKSADEQLPSKNLSIFTKLVEGLKRLIASFYPVEEKTDKEITLNVWVNRARNYLDLLERITDEKFTAKTGIKVKYSLMPNEQKLILANASGTSPDIALGISNWLPYDLGVRKAALDLRQFPDFAEVSKEFSPGAFLPFIIDEKVYALPETQDFYLLFYRKDILDSLNLPIPNTWDDVIKILPELQRNGMNFYTPLAGTGGFKPFMATIPFIYQANADIYTDNGFQTAIDSENSLKALKLMTDLYTIYGLPLQVPNFFEHFRDGTMPIGIGDFATYVKLNIAAKELRGLWGVALAPGIKDGNEVLRYAPGSAQAAMIFNNTKEKEAAWEYLKWWVSRETQSEFANDLDLFYGKEYLWNSANLAAFSKLNIPKEDKMVILEQWKWLHEVPRAPGFYMIERELSNIWSKVVFNNSNLRATVENSVIEINKEITRKMEEFGYIRNQKIIKEYHIPTIAEVKSWGE